MSPTIVYQMGTDKKDIETNFRLGSHYRQMTKYPPVSGYDFLSEKITDLKDFINSMRALNEVHN